MPHQNDTFDPLWATAVTANVTHLPSLLLYIYENKKFRIEGGNRKRLFVFKITFSAHLFL